MTAFTALTLNDGNATPVAHTFSPKSNDLRVTKWEDRVSGVPIGYATIEVKTSESANVRRVDTNIAVPTLEAVSGSNPSGFTPAPAIAYVHRHSSQTICPLRGTLQERKNLVAFLVNAYQTALWKALVQDTDEVTG